ncbi:MAG TPA: TetR/AcrR family transcriptional regulator [Burkholderiaceae bacterium]|jgi:AcrR family transcriptional regulator|nr:TetR/AcrR family transcriptional regulator [Burkholderiaceae bacterium]
MREDILTTALTLLDEGGGQGLTLRALAARLGVTPMSLYHHVGDQVGLLRALSDRVYAEVMKCPKCPGDAQAEIQALLTRFYEAVGHHPQLILAIFSMPQAFSGVTRQITDRLTTLLTQITTDPIIWRDILVDHTHGSGLALAATQGDRMQAQALQARYQQALTQLLSRLTPSSKGSPCS